MHTPPCRQPRVSPAVVLPLTLFLASGTTVIARRVPEPPHPREPDVAAITPDAPVAEGDEERFPGGSNEESADVGMTEDVGAEDDDDEARGDPEGFIRFMPLGFQPPEHVPGALFGAVDEAVVGVEGVPLRLGEERAGRLREALRETVARRARLEEQHETLRREVSAARDDEAALVEQALGVEHWAALIHDRVERLDEADALWRARSVAARCMRAIARAGIVRIEEGVARGVPQETLDRLVAGEEIRTREGFQYHAEPLDCDPTIAGRLTALVVDERHLAGLGGGKFCGGFHPDLRLDYGGVAVLVCFGCREIRYATSSTTVTFDLTEAALAKLETIARQVFLHRTFDDAAEGP